MIAILYTRTLRVCFLFFCVTGLVACSQAAEDEKNTKPPVVLSGADSHIVKPSLRLIMSDEAWKRAWAAHLGTTVDDAYRPEMGVDFDRYMVVAIFRGERVNTRRVAIESTSAIRGSTLIRIIDLGYQTAGKDNGKPPDRPYAFVVLPKSTKGVIVEENVQQYKGEPPEWKEWSRIEARATGQQLEKDAQ
jgi:hypothetical protein